MIKFYDITKNDDKYSKKIYETIKYNIRNNDFVNGNSKKLFEKNFAKYIGVKHCIGVANGTDALEIALRALNLPKNSEVLLQWNTYISTAFSISNNDLKPIFVDVNIETHMIDIDNIEKYITPKTKAICVVHLYGSSPNMEKIIYIANKYRLYLIEDCAQSHGSLYKKQKTGSFGHISCFSFYPSKNLGCYGDGGAICTNDQCLYEQIVLLHNLGIKGKNNHILIGKNSRLDSIQASILDLKLQYLDMNNMKRNRIANIYISHLKSEKKIILPIIDENCSPVWHLFVIRVLNNKRDCLKSFLKSIIFETAIHYPIPIHKQQAYLQGNDTYVNSEIICDQLLSLPMYPSLELKHIYYICYKIKLFFM